jgi:hypothetical protein
LVGPEGSALEGGWVEGPLRGEGRPEAVGRPAAVAAGPAVVVAAGPVAADDAEDEASGARQR